MEFFGSIILHLDILACASTGQGPQYADLCAAALGDGDSKVRLERIMGSENWAMVLIREIAVLWDWRRKESLEKCSTSAVEFEGRVKDIENRLDIGLGRLSDRRSPGDWKTENSRGMAVCTITEAYAHAAKIYLHVLASGPHPELPKIRESVSSTLATLVELAEPMHLRNAVWPFCIAGCMARTDQRQAFAELGSAASIDRGVFVSLCKALEVCRCAGN